MWFEEKKKPVKKKLTKTKLIIFLILLPIISFLVTLLILAIPYNIANTVAHATGTEIEFTDYWTYVFQNGWFWPTFGVVLLISPIITAIIWNFIANH